MLKRFSVALAALFVLAAPCFGAGTIPYSLSQQFDKFGHVLAGCKLNIIQAGTVGSPQVAYQDTALTIPVPGGSQLTCDAAGRLPQFFLADGNIKIQLTDVNGVLQVTADNILVIGNSSGGGGGSPVDPTTVLQTGDIKAVYGTGVVTGFVRLNGRTIGSASSGASERANADTQALFQYLWGADPNLAVSTGRGVSANADWVANKQLTLPDARGRALAGLDDMGNALAGVLTSTYLGAAPNVLGALGGAQSYALGTTNLPPYTPLGALSLNAGSLAGTYTGGTPVVEGSGSGIGGGGTFGVAGGTGVSISGAPNGSFTGTAQGGTSTAFPIVQPTMLITLYQKL